MFPHQNPLPKPDIITTPSFEILLQQVKEGVLTYLQTHAPGDVEAVRETLASESAILTKFAEAFTVILQNYSRQINGQALQMFGMYATDTAMVDVIASRLGVTRQVLDEGDPDAFPPVPPTMESNDALLTRYYLAAFALASTGTRSGYRFHAMTLGGRPKMTIESPEPDTVVVTYKFEPHSFGGQAKDVQARKVSDGVVDCYLLVHDGTGLPSAELLAATQSYLTRDDIGQETDLLTVKAPTITPWRCAATLYLRPGPDTELAKAAAEKAVWSFGELQHMLGGRVEPSALYSVLTQASSAHRVDITEPAQPIRCAISEAPYLESVTITVITEDV